MKKPSSKHESSMKSEHKKSQLSLSKIPDNVLVMAVEGYLKIPLKKKSKQSPRSLRQR